MAVVFAVTAVAVAVKNAPVPPAGTVSVAGTDKAELLLDKLTARPPAGAGALNVTVHESTPAPLIVPLLQNSPLSAPGVESPVPLRLMTAVPLAGAFVAMVSDPVAAPAVCGSNVTSTVTELPGFSVTGKPGPATANPAPVTVAPETVSAAVPDDSTVTNCGVACVLTVTSPKARLLALTVRAGVPVLACVGSSCRLKVAELVPRLAVIVALCAALTAAAVAVKLTLLAFAATAMVAGTVTAESLLDKLMVSPLLSASLRVTVHVSVPAPTNVAFPHVTALTVGVGGGGVTTDTPVPLRENVMLPVVALVATVTVPAAVPAAAGLNCTFRLTVPAPGTVSGSAVWPASEKYCPETLICVICTGSALAFLSETVALAVCPTVTLPNASALIDATRLPIVVLFGAIDPQPDITAIAQNTAASKMNAPIRRRVLPGR